MTPNEPTTSDASEPSLQGIKESRSGLREPNLSLQEIVTIRDAEELFEKMTHDRHRMGNEKYGRLTFLQMPTLEMALEELADLANYARYSFVKVALLRDQIKAFQDKSITAQPGFHTVEEILGIKKEL